MLNKIASRFIWSSINLPPIKRWRQRKAVERWLQDGKHGPAPHLVKQSNLRALQHRFNVPILIETGTFRGDMMVAMSPHFRQLYSVELSAELCDYAKKRCANLSNVTITHGASEQRLSEIVSAVSGIVLFWLDGHFSGHDTAMGATECPVPAELKIILEQTQILPVIVIDDARKFTGKRSYPTVAEIACQVSARSRRMHLSVHDDAMFIIPDVLLVDNVH